MKYATLSAVIVAALSSVNIASASDGTITFNGELQATTCNVSVDGLGSDANVTLPVVGVSQLSTAGATAGQTKFSIDLSNCEGTQNTATAFFESGQNVDSNGRLSNTGSAGTNVSLQLRDGSNTNTPVIIVGNTSQETNNFYGDIANGSLSLPYLVEYYANQAAIPGLVNSSVTYSIIYK
ncbi:fimbrial protein [Pantoea sp. BAV 3049]|uniref:fimbrial protein n=1 Tax=Pantoea sp. BAV 3049 TaxID=2654188 RepID=UPI00131E54F3|nr:fimbrial protein [Pantoea sp. BAV 3049]